MLAAPERRPDVPGSSATARGRFWTSRASKRDRRTRACGVLPRDHRVLEEFGEIIWTRRSRRELRDTVLRQRAFDEGGDISRRVADRLEPVRRLQLLHEPGDPIGQDI